MHPFLGEENDKENCAFLRHMLHGNCASIHCRSFIFTIVIGFATIIATWKTRSSCWKQNTPLRARLLEKSFQGIMSREWATIANVKMFSSKCHVLLSIHMSCTLVVTDNIDSVPHVMTWWVGKFDAAFVGINRNQRYPIISSWRLLQRPPLSTFVMVHYTCHVRLPVKSLL